jgi:uncharacterized protein (AIM24 family)
MIDGVIRETKFQGLSKAVFTGEDLSGDRVLSVGVLFVTPLGAIVQRNLKRDEQWIVDNGHLVAWNCPYTIEKSGGEFMSGTDADEGVVCRFTGPGIVFVQLNIYLLSFV